MITYTNFTVMKNSFYHSQPQYDQCKQSSTTGTGQKAQQGAASDGMKLLHLIGMVLFAGMPQNQLGTLAGTKAFGCEGAYFYMRW